jgi:hypothetical protein
MSNGLRMRAAFGACRLLVEVPFTLPDLTNDYGGTIEVPLKEAPSASALRRDSRPYQQRVGVLKISGMLHGSVSASVKILWLLVRYDPSRSLAAPPRCH